LCGIRLADVLWRVDLLVRYPSEEFAMNPELSQRVWPRRIWWDVILAAVFGGCILAILILATGGILISLVTAAAALVIFGLLNYLFWGQSLLKDVAREREKAELRARDVRDESKPTDEVIMLLSDRERVELIHALEESLEKNTVAVSAPSGNHEAIRGVLDKLRGFGA
jgi:hypothetical protein